MSLDKHVGALPWRVLILPLHIHRPTLGQSTSLGVEPYRIALSTGTYKSVFSLCNSRSGRHIVDIS